MKIGVPRERRAGETRVAVSPDTVKKYVGLGIEVAIQTGAGNGSNFTDEAFKAAGATIVPDEAAALRDADVVLKVQRPLTKAEGEDELATMKQGAVLAAILAPHAAREQAADYAAKNIVAFAMEFMPRITRAQVMDVLSSQSNLAGYRAVIDAAQEYGRAFPMMMTAAGTIAPARALVMGAGVAGLQAIATLRRLGAIVSATDVRPAAKEQVESLGATFVAGQDDEFKQAETAGGYAKEMSAEYKAKQAALVAEHVKKQDIVITTALIPGRPAPRLLSAEHVASMKPGSVIIDMAVEQGGNTEGAKFGETVVTANGVKIVGIANLPGAVAADASNLYARNLVSFAGLLVNKEGALAPDWEDEILKAAVVAQGGKIIHPSLT